MPGTGKTATVRAVNRNLENDFKEGKINPYKFCEINGLKLTKPERSYTRGPSSLRSFSLTVCLLHFRAYSVFLKQLTGEKILNPNEAKKKLEAEFKKKAHSRRALRYFRLFFSRLSLLLANIVLFLDEIDMLLTKDQSILYNFFELPRQRSSQLVIIAISNTLDLPDTLEKKVCYLILSMPFHLKFSSLLFIDSLTHGKQPDCVPSLSSRPSRGDSERPPEQQVYDPVRRGLDPTHLNEGPIPCLRDLRVTC